LNSEARPNRPERRRRIKLARKTLSSLLRDLRIELVPIGKLKPYKLNARTHSEKQIGQIELSILTNGFANPILTDDDLNLIAGHGRLLAAQRIGLKHVPVIRIAHLSESQKRALRLADNKIAENAGWDLTVLAQELEYLSTLDFDFDLALTGFETPEIDVLIQSNAACASDGDDDEIPEIDRSNPPVTRVGDLWIVGDHRLICADSTDQTSFRKLIGRKKAQLVFTDPPYNVPIDGNVSGLGSIKHREFPMASGEMTIPQFIAFLKTVLRNLVAFSTAGSIHFLCMDWRHVFELLSAGRGVYSELKNICIWAKNNAGMGSLYRSQHELVLVFKNGTAPHINNVELGRFGRHRTNIWHYLGGNGRRDELAMHPTVKPVAMVADAILDCSQRGGIVLDCFGGSGTTLIAAGKTGRRAYVMELDPIYVDTTINRFEKLTSQQAIHSDTGRTFAQMKLERVGMAPESDEEQQNSEEVDDVQGL
jgi:DNA modification methylase